MISQFRFVSSITRIKDDLKTGVFSMKQNIHCVHNIVHFHHRFHFRAQKRRMSVECMKGKLGELSRRMITKEKERNKP